MSFADKYDLTTIVTVNGANFAYSKELGKALLLSGDEVLIAATSGKIDMTLEEWEDEATRNRILSDIVDNL